MLIFFDLDDTLIPSSEIYQNSLAKLGLDWMPDLFARAREEVKSQLPNGHVVARNRLLYFKRYLELQGAFSAQLTLDLMTTYERGLFDGVSAYWNSCDRRKDLERLSKNHELAIITNENCRTQLIKISAMHGADRLFSKIWTSEEVGFEKPSMQFFQTALVNSREKNGEVIMIGDSLENDIFPMRELGAHTVWYQEFLPLQNRKNGYEIWGQFQSQPVVKQGQRMEVTDRWEQLIHFLESEL